MSGTRSSLFTDPGVASAAGILARAIAADDPYKDLAHLGSAANSISQAEERNMNIRAQEEAYAAADPRLRNTPEGTTSSNAAMIRAGLRAGAPVQSVAPNMVLALTTAQGTSDPAVISRLQAGSRMAWPGTIQGAREGETGANTRAGIAAGATLGAARIAQEGANYRFLRGDAQPGHTVGVDRGAALGFAPPPGPDGQPGPRTPYTLPERTTVGPDQTAFSPTPGFAPTTGAPAPPTVVEGVRSSVARPMVDAILNGTTENLTDPQRNVGLDVLTPGVRTAQVNAASRLQVARERNNNMVTRLPGAEQALVAAERARADAVANDPNASPEEKLAAQEALTSRLMEVMNARQSAPTLSQENARRLAELRAKPDKTPAEIDEERRLSNPGETSAVAAGQSRERIAALSADAAMARVNAQIDGRLQGIRLSDEGRQAVAQLRVEAAAQLQTDRSADEAARQTERLNARIEEIKLQNQGRVDAAVAGARPGAGPSGAVQQQLRQDIARALLTDAGRAPDRSVQPTALPNLAVSRLTPDQRTVMEQLETHAARLLGDPQSGVRTVADAIHRAKQELGYEAVPAGSGWFGDRASFRLVPPNTPAPSSTQAPAPSQAPTAGRPRAVNPQTGQAMIYNGSAWVPE